MGWRLGLGSLGFCWGAGEGKLLVGGEACMRRIGGAGGGLFWRWVDGVAAGFGITGCCWAGGEALHATDGSDGAGGSLS
jgi:hypothetical protein